MSLLAAILLTAYLAPVLVLAGGAIGFYFSLDRWVDRSGLALDVIVGAALGALLYLIIIWAVEYG